MQTPKVKDVMTKTPHMVSADASLSEARGLMSTHGVRHLPVVDRGRIFGLLSERDISLAQSILLRFPREDRLLVRDVCHQEPYVVTPDTLLSEVARHMAERQIGSALVAQGEALEGIFTTIDACRWIGEHFK